MQIKNILIASLFATIMLLVPFTSISDGSVIVNNPTIVANPEANPVNLNEPYSTYCFMLKMLFLYLTGLYIFFESIDNKVICQLIFNFAFALFEYGIKIGCWDDPPLIFESETVLNQQISNGSISEYNIIISKLIHSYELNGCPCFSRIERE